jgi:peroxiredoxin Q/BCP
MESAQVRLRPEDTIMNELHSRTGFRVAWIRLTLGILTLIPVGFVAADDPKVDLKAGDRAPVFTATDDQGKEWKSADHVGKKYVVIYFYPGDFTPGCTVQARAFRDGMAKLTEKGVVVVGVSGDTVNTHYLFKKAQMLPFTLLSDENGDLARKFGVPVGKGVTVRIKGDDGQLITLRRKVALPRWTFVLNREGRIVSKNTNMSPAQDVKMVAEVIGKLKKK